jgi:hypothetical protein
MRRPTCSSSGTREDARRQREAPAFEFVPYPEIEIKREAGCRQNRREQHEPQDLPKALRDEPSRRFYPSNSGRILNAW